MPEPENPSLEERVTALEKKAEEQDQHLVNAATALNNAGQAYVLMAKAIEEVQDKTWQLSKHPPRTNCPNCGRIVRNPNTDKCPTCGTRFKR